MEKTKHLRNIIIAAGGTGGHLFPAQAVALELISRYPDVTITFMGSGLQKSSYFKKELFSFIEVASATPFKKNVIALLRALFSLIRGTLSSLRFLRKKTPDLIVGFGSFHSFPTLLAAKLLSVPIVLFESNAFPGRVNRLFSKWATLSAIQFSHIARHLSSKSVCVRMPLLERRRLLSKREARTYFGLNPDQLTLLIFGGSQGSQAVNCFFCDAIQHLRKEGLSFQVIHIAGSVQRAEKLRAYYASQEVPASVKHFEERMECAWSAADLNISRAGATTLAELIEYGVPSILIPYPFGSENHQLKNALFIAEEVKGAVAIEESALSGETLTQTITRLLQGERRELLTMKKALTHFKEEEKREDLCDVLQTLLFEKLHFSLAT